jgi:peptidoglycan/LPS O-acetylase OafA/YrhL
MSETNHSKERPNYYLLTIARFFAALWVVLLHVPQMTPKHVRGNLTWFDNFIFSNGGLGVNFFFVLSGYILTKLYPPTFDKPKFLWKRFARIYPAYFLLLLFPIALYVYRGKMFGTSGLEMAACTASTIALIHAWIPSFTHAINGPGWSLSCEAFFYVAFPYLRGNDKPPKAWLLGLVGLLTLSPWIVWHVLTASWGFGIDPSKSSLGALPHFPLVAIPDFIFGILIAKIPIQESSRGKLLATGIITLIALCAVNLPGFATIPCALIILGLSATKPANQLTKTERMMEVLGHASYTLYLIHFAFIKFVADKGFIKNNLQASVAVIAAVILSIVFYLLVDKPLSAWLGRFKFDRRAKNPTAFAVSK